MKKIFLLCFFCIGATYGQKKDMIYRIAEDFKDAAGYSYNINVLKLHENKLYSLIEQEYHSKKLAKKNVPSRFLKTEGTWEISNDTLKLIDNKNKTEMLFIKKNNSLIYLFDNVDKSASRWIEVKY